MSKLAEDFLRPFGGAELEQLLTLALQMERFGLTPADVIPLARGRIMEEAVKGGLNTGRLHGPAPSRMVARCPKCGAALKIQRVNVSACTRVGGDWQTSVMCESESCRFTELSHKTIAEWRAGL